jgi:dCMP deaminase
MNDANKWDDRFLDMAHLVSTWSKDPSTKVGAVIVDENKRIISTGFNGFPKDVNDYPFRLENKDLKYQMTIHAERNAILFAQRDLANCSLYVWPIQCCAECASMVIQSGIKKVVIPDHDIAVGAAWKESFKVAQMMFDEAGVKVIKHDRG